MRSGGILCIRTAVDGASRIKNGTFTINGETSHIPENEHNGEDTLHGGFVGYDQQNWTVASHTGNSITFMFYDEAKQGFPGDVLNVATYTLTDEPAFVSRMVSIPLNDATPIMLANHIYWNLGAFVNEEAIHILNDTLYMPYADRYINIDGIEVPTGGISLTNGTALDFTKPNKQIGQDIYNTLNGCGTGCVGYDNAFILDRSPYGNPKSPNLEVLQMYSPSTGIKLSLETNQAGLQIYSCNGQNGTIPVKSGQQHISGKTTYVEKYGCLVIETQDVSSFMPKSYSADDEFGLTLRLFAVDRRHQPASMGSRMVASLHSHDGAGFELRQILVLCLVNVIFE